MLPALCSQPGAPSPVLPARYSQAAPGRAEPGRCRDRGQWPRSPRSDLGGSRWGTGWSRDAALSQAGLRGAEPSRAVPCRAEQDRAGPSRTGQVRDRGQWPRGSRRDRGGLGGVGAGRQPRCRPAESQPARRGTGRGGGWSRGTALSQPGCELWSGAEPSRAEPCQPCRAEPGGAGRCRAVPCRARPEPRYETNEERLSRGRTREDRGARCRPWESQSRRCGAFARHREPRVCCGAPGRAAGGDCIGWASAGAGAAQRGWGHWGSARMVAPGSAPACSGREQPGWMERRGLYGGSRAAPRSGGCGGSAVGGMRPAGQGSGTLPVAMVPVICETSLHPFSMGPALSCPGARLDSWAMEPQNALSCLGPAVPGCCQRQS